MRSKDKSMANEWRRIAVKQADGQRADILVALANVNRVVNDKLPLYEFMGGLIAREWEHAKANGLVSDAMLRLEDAVETFTTVADPFYGELDAGA
jgi:hypothetical protein